MTLTSWPLTEVEKTGAWLGRKQQAPLSFWTCQGCDAIGYGDVKETVGCMNLGLSRKLGPEIQMYQHTVNILNYGTRFT